MAKGGKSGKALKRRSHAKNGKYTFVVYREDRTVEFTANGIDPKRHYKTVRFPTAKAAKYQIKKAHDYGAKVTGDGQKKAA